MRMSQESLLNSFQHCVVDCVSNELCRFALSDHSCQLSPAGNQAVNVVPVVSDLVNSNRP
jgi:hypothetical protein